MAEGLEHAPISAYIIAAASVVLGRALATSRDRDKGWSYPNGVLTLCLIGVAWWWVSKQGLTHADAFAWSMPAGVAGEAVIKPMVERVVRMANVFNGPTRDDYRAAGVKVIDRAIDAKEPPSITPDVADLLRELAEKEKDKE